MFEHLLVPPSLRQLCQWGKPMGKGVLTLIPSGQATQGLSVEKNCPLAKREGLGNANLIPIEQATSCSVTQGRVEEELIHNWKLRLRLHPIQPNPQVGCSRLLCNCFVIPQTCCFNNERRH